MAGSIWKNLASLFVILPDEARGSQAPADLPAPLPEQRASYLDRPNATLESTGVIGAMYFASKSGVVVDEKAILSLPAFYRAIKILTGVVASLPLEVVEESAEGTETQRKDHPVYRLLNLNPSPLYNRFKFFETLVLHYLAHGNFYAIINYRLGRPNSLTIVDKPHEVTAEYNDRGDLFYKLSGSGKRISADRVIHVSNIAWNGIMGHSQPELHKDNFGLAIANRDYGNTFYRNGAHLSGVLRHPGRLTQDAYTRLRQSWDARYTGGDNAGKTAILEEGMEYASIGLKPSDAAFGETKKLTTADISLITGVPRFLLEDSDPTFNNGETITRQFTNYTILPLCENIEAEFNRKLFFESEQGRIRTRFNLNQLLRADTEQRGRYIDNLMKWGIINRDEARKMEGWNPIQDGSGQAYYVPLNMVDPTKPQPVAGEQLDLFGSQTDNNGEGNTGA